MDRILVGTSVFSRLCRATPAEALDVVSALTESERARLALFCNARTHLRAVGRAIAATCSAKALALEGGEPGAVLHRQAQLGPDTWDASRAGPIAAPE